MLVTMEHPKAGTIKQIGTPFKFSVSTTELSLYPPELSEHTDEVLDELGYSESEIKMLREKGVI